MHAWQGYIVDDLGKYSGDGEITVQQFVTKINHVASYRTAKDVAFNIPKVLTGKAQAWFVELEDETSGALRHNLRAFKEALVKRFTISSAEALDQLVAETYSIKDAKERRDPGDYVRKIVRLSKLAGLSQDAALQRAWKQISSRLAQGVLQPLPSQSVDGFIETLDRVKLRWYEDAVRFSTERPPDRQRYPNSSPSTSRRPQQRPWASRDRMLPASQQPRAYHENAEELDDDEDEQDHEEIPEAYRAKAYQAAVDLCKYNISAWPRDGVPAYSCGHCDNRAFSSIHALRGHAKQVHGHQPDRIGW